jgi:hypothetical protein
VAVVDAKDTFFGQPRFLSLVTPYCLTNYSFTSGSNLSIIEAESYSLFPWNQGGYKIV